LPGGLPTEFVTEAIASDGSLIWNSDWGTNFKTALGIKLVTKTEEEIDAEVAKHKKDKAEKIALEKVVKEEVQSDAPSSASAVNVKSESGTVANAPAAHDSSANAEIIANAAIDQETQEVDHGGGDDEVDEIDYRLCPNTNCPFSLVAPTDMFCKSCGIPTDNDNAEVKRDMAANKKMRLAPMVSAGIHMLNLKSHLLTSAELDRMTFARKRGQDSTLRSKARKCEKEARMHGYTGHREKMENDAVYAETMIGFPPEFCDDVIPELVNFKVWPGGVCPPELARPAVAKGKSTGASSSKDGAKGGGKNKGKGKGGKTKKK
jgi:hypothetical protein